MRRMSKSVKLGSAVAVALLIVAAVALPNLTRDERPHARNACVNNLRMLDGAKQQWALENRRAKGDPVAWDDIKPSLKVPLECSRGGTYILGRVGELPRCSTGGDHSLPPDTDP